MLVLTISIMNFLKKKFSVGIFGMNASSGISMVNIPQRWDQKWDNIKFVAKFLDKNNFDFILPIARWKGYGGSTNPTGNCYETLSFSGCLSGITKKIFLFATVCFIYSSCLRIQVFIYN